MKPRSLAGPFARRMTPLALTAGLLVGVALPATYQILALREQVKEAYVWARHTADQLEALARTRPRLWAYDEIRLAEIAYPLTSTPVSARVRIDAEGIDRVFMAGPTPRPSEVAGWAAVHVKGRVAGRVRIALQAVEPHAAALRLWIAASLAGALLAAGLFFLPLRTVRRGDRQNHELWSALEKANATLEARVERRTAELRRRERELRELGARLVAVQEEERARISRDLHDDLGQTLTGLRLRLTTLASLTDVGESARQQVEAAISAVDGGVEQVRRLAHNMRPPALDVLGLPAALRGHAERWAETSGVEIELRLADQEPPVHAAEVLFRVAQEALTNVARHAEARRVEIDLGPFDDGWRLVIEDDGKGLPAEPAKERTHGGLGLVGARERVEQAGGYLDIELGRIGGVRLTAWLAEESS